jgi:L-lactate dehydrogenase complex protein LldG
MSRDHVLHKIRTALGRGAGQEPPPPPAARICIPEVDAETKARSLLSNIEALAGKTQRVATAADALRYVTEAIAGKTAIASNAPYLAECGIASLPQVRSGVTGKAELRELCATCDVGITSADYALADTGSLVMIASPNEARMISLLPPAHIAVVPRERILSGLDELFTLLPHPAEQTSSMVLITGPSRTADIEQILVRGVHGPGLITVVVVG